MTADGQSEVVTEYTYSPSGALTTADDTITVSYAGLTATVSITVEASSQTSNQITIVNNSSVDAEIYYEDDQEEAGNTSIQAGATVRVFIDAQYPYYIRMESGGSGNDYAFEGTYAGNSFDGDLGFYDGNVQPPEATGSATEWQFSDGDNGTITITTKEI